MRLLTDEGSQLPINVDGVVMFEGSAGVEVAAARGVSAALFLVAVATMP